jgi:hypothetical protein
MMMMLTSEIAQSVAHAKERGDQRRDGIDVAQKQTALSKEPREEHASSRLVSVCSTLLQKRNCKKKYCKKEMEKEFLGWKEIVRIEKEFSG